MIDFAWNIFPYPKTQLANLFELYLITKEE